MLAEFPGGGAVVVGDELPSRATVVVPLHNHADWIGPLLQSLFMQWRPDFALLVVDDASSDGSFAAAMRALETRPDIRATILRNEYPLNHDIAGQVLRFTSSPVIVKADSDDVAMPGRLDAMLACFDADPACHLVTSNAVLLTADGMPAGLYEVDEPDQVVSDPAHWAGRSGSNLWLGATMAFHRAVLADFPPVDAELCPYGLDIVLAFRATLLGTHHFIARPLVGWRQHARNAHRVAGVLDPRIAARERYEALELMALAQRVRDAKHARNTAADPARYDAAVADSQDTYFERHESWCRLRNRAVGASIEAPAAGRVPPMPPIATLRPGRHLFGVAGPLGAVASAWHGFYLPEEAWNWTSSAALLVLRTTPAVSRLVLTLAGRSWLGRQQASVSVNFGPRVDIGLNGAEPAGVEVPVPDRWAADCIVLLIEAQNARSLQEIEPTALDVRRLGLMLLALELA